MYFKNDTEILHEIGLRIKRERIAARLTQSELAECAFLSLLTIKNAERGRSLSFRNVIAILRGLKRLDVLEKFLHSPAMDVQSLFGGMKKKQSRVRHGKRQISELAQ